MFQCKWLFVCTNQDTMVGKSGVKIKWVNENHDNPVMIPINEPTITWLHVWYCKYVLLIHTNAVKHQHDTKTNNRPARSSGNRVLLFMWCNLKEKEQTLHKMHSIGLNLNPMFCAWSRNMIYLMRMNSVTYVEKNQINCEWLDGMPNSVPIWSRFIGLGSLIQCFNIILLTSFTKVPIKNAIWKWHRKKMSHKYLSSSVKISSFTKQKIIIYLLCASLYET